MAHEILAVKLCQLDDRMGRLHSRIHMSETADHRQLQPQIEALRQECDVAEEMLKSNMQHSQSELVAILARGYAQMESVVQDTLAQLKALAADSPDADAAVEEKILLAEYALDFAQQAADRALLLSLDAIDAQLLQEEGSTL